MSKGNPILRPDQIVPSRPCDRTPRAARGTGAHSRRKAKARCEMMFVQRWDGPAYVTEHRFHPVRKWRFDYAWPDAKVAFEIEGGIFSRGAHVRPRGIADDIDKGNAANELGWRVFRACDLSDLIEAIRQIKAALAGAKGNGSPATAPAANASTPAAPSPRQRTARAADAPACEPEALATKQ